MSEPTAAAPAEPTLADVEVRIVQQLPDDVVEVTGYVAGVTTESGEPTLLIARGWVSAMERHYPDDERDEDGHRVEGAEPRPMTEAERHDYWRGLLLEAAAGHRAPAPVVLYEIAAAGETSASAGPTE